ERQYLGAHIISPAPPKIPAQGWNDGSWGLYPLSTTKITNITTVILEDTQYLSSILESAKPYHRHSLRL
ncbi:hypothetical protein, partial [Vibrio breoganii]|uniref:hypothetical protein n=1 Tax=Vibrio breoganii TaxID=553239 RepID=UPI001A7E0E9A